MNDFNRKIRSIAEENPDVFAQLRKAFPDAFPAPGKFIIHIGTGRKVDQSGINSIYFLCEEKEDTESRYMANLNGSWSDLTSGKYPDTFNKLFTGTLKVEDGVLIEVNET